MTERLEVTVDSRVRISGPLSGDVRGAIEEAFTYKNPEIAKKRAMGLSTWGTPETIATWRDEAGALTIPRGGMGKLRTVLGEHGIGYRVRDARTEGGVVAQKLRYVGLPLRDYQREMVAVGLAKEQCILRAATGSGKTTMAFALTAEIGLNTIVVLPTKGLFDQWAERARSELGVSGDALGVVQGKRRRLRPLTLAMQATLARGVDPELIDFFGAVLVDETQRAAAVSLVRVIDAFSARYRIGVSASERRKDRKEFLIYDLFGDVAYEAGRDMLTEAGHVLDVEIRVVPTEFRAPWYGPDAGDLDYARLLDEMTADVARNELAHEHALREVASGEQAIVLTHRREHARDLRRLFVRDHVEAGQMLGDGEPGDDDEFARTRAGIEDGSVRVGVGTYGALGYGIDLPAISVGVATTPIASNEQNFNQVRGRLCRPNPKAGKTRGRMYVLWDRHVFGLRHLKNIAAWNRNVVVLSDERWIPADEYLGRGRHNGARKVG